MDRVYLNAEESIKRFGGKKNLYVRLLNHFFEDKSFENLQSCAEQGDMENMQLHAHSLKGLGANLSLPALRESAAALEASLKAGQLDDKAFNELKEIMEVTVAEIKNYLES